jgi:OmpA-OmpF porin, OOP family
MRMLFAALVAAAVPLASVAAQTGGPYVVYFGTGKAATTLTPQARAILDTAVRTYRNGATATVVLAGHSDGVNSRSKVAESYARVLVVRDYVMAAGVPESSLTLQSYGSARPAVETTRPEPRNRRVEITFGPSSGW